MGNHPEVDLGQRSRGETPRSTRQLYRLFRPAVAEAGFCPFRFFLDALPVAAPDFAAFSDNEDSKVLRKEMRNRAEAFCRLTFLLSDFVAIFSALVIAYYARFDVLAWLLPAESFFAPSGGIQIENYATSIVLGSTLLVFILFLNGAYDNRTLLRFRCFFFLLCKTLLIWLVAFAGISLILEFDERLSRVYVLISVGLLFAFSRRFALALQRVLLTTQASHSTLRQRIVRRSD